jgi:hypothetical protein
MWEVWTEIWMSADLLLVQAVNLSYISKLALSNNQQWPHEYK